VPKEVGNEVFEVDSFQRNRIRNTTGNRNYRHHRLASDSWTESTTGYKSAI
jgi:hypothetical protein